MFRQRLVSQNGLALCAVGVGYRSAPQLSPRLCRGTVNYKSKSFLADIRKDHIPQRVFFYSRLAESLPASVCRQPGRPMSLTADVPHIRAYGTRRHVPRSPSARHAPQDELPDILQPVPEVEEPDPEDFMPKKEIKYIERGFLAVFVVLYLMYLGSKGTLLVKHKKEMEEQERELRSRPDAPSRIRIVMEGSKGVEVRVLKPGREGDGTQLLLEDPAEHDFDFGKAEIKLSKPSTLFNLLHDDFHFSPSRIFPIDAISDQGFRPWTAVTCALMHGGPLHLIACYMTLKVFTTPLIHLYGPQKFLGLFFAGAGLASMLYAGVERMVNPAVNMTPGQLSRIITDKDADADPKEVNAIRRYFVNSAGSSGALVALGTITMFVSPWTRASILVLPSMSIRTVMSILFAFDVCGQFIFDYGLHINHGVHLAGYVAGYALYRTLVRRWPYSKNHQDYLSKYMAAQINARWH